MSCQSNSVVMHLVFATMGKRVCVCYPIPDSLAHLAYWVAQLQWTISYQFFSFFHFSPIVNGLTIGLYKVSGIHITFTWAHLWLIAHLCKSVSVSLFLYRFDHKCKSVWSEWILFRCSTLHQQCREVRNETSSHRSHSKVVVKFLPVMMKCGEWGLRTVFNFWVIFCITNLGEEVSVLIDYSYVNYDWIGIQVFLSYFICSLIYS